MKVAIVLHLLFSTVTMYGGFFVNFQSSNLTANSTLQAPNIGLTTRIIPVSINGNFADTAGNITIATSPTTGAVISFANPQVYNSIASPSSSNITDNLTGARIGVIQKIYHNAGTAPTFPAGWVLRGTGAYVTSALNIIYAEWSVGTTVEYWITQ